jgi:hypothetical protein
MHYFTTRMAHALMLVPLGFGPAAFGAEPAPEVNWGPCRVQLDENWPGGEVGIEWETLHAGIGLCRAGAPADNGIADYEFGWMAEGEDGCGVAGLLEGEFDMESRLEVAAFGRTGDQIQLVMVLHRSGGALPESMKDYVRRKMRVAEKSRAPVTFADARSVNLGGKRVLFAGGFPEDLPPGKYRVTVELRDQDGKVKQHYERRLVRGRPQKDPLAGLSDPRLLEEYVKRGEALRGSDVEPTDSGFGHTALATWYESPLCRAWTATHREIVRRGVPIVPGLMKMLETEAVRNPDEATHSTAKFGFAVDVMRMLGEIGDPRPVPLLVRVMEGMDGKANLMVRRKAMTVTEGLTYVTFLVDRDRPDTALGMMGDGALVFSRSEKPNDWGAQLEEVAGLYAKWLDNAGRDPARWLALARERARKALEGSDPVAIRNAIAFLTPSLFCGNAHDNRPEQTMRAIAQVITRSDQTAAHKVATWTGLPGVLATYGPAARPYVKYIVAEAKQRSGVGGCMNLEHVGGEEAMAFMVQSLPQLRQRVKEFGVESDVDLEQVWGLEAGNAVLPYRGYRWGVERWAGRTFATDQEIADWWIEAKSQSQRQWLEENLDRTSAEADAGSAKAQYIIRHLLPDLPHADDDKPFDPPWLQRGEKPYRENQPKPYRVRWLKDNRTRLEYDARQSVFTRRGK